MSLTLLERVKKSKDLYRDKPIFPHTLVEIPEAGEGLMGCTVCGGFEGTLLQNCPGEWCCAELDNVYFGRGGGKMYQIEDHWHIMLDRALKKRDMDMHEAIRSVP